MRSAPTTLTAWKSRSAKTPGGVPLDGIPFHPYYTVKDIFGAVVFMILFFGVVFFAPSFGGLFLEPANFEPANHLKTPEHIAPVWYFTPFYSILRAVPGKFMGAVLMGASVMLFFLLPWLDRGRVRSIRYRGWMFRLALALFTVSFIALGWIGLQPASPAITTWSRVFTVIYFLFFLLMPLYTRWDPERPEPERVRY